MDVAPVGQRPFPTPQQRRACGSLGWALLGLGVVGAVLTATLARRRALCAVPLVGAGVGLALGLVCRRAQVEQVAPVSVAVGPEWAQIQQIRLELGPTQIASGHRFPEQVTLPGPVAYALQHQLATMAFCPRNQKNHPPYQLSWVHPRLVRQEEFSAGELERYNQATRLLGERLDQWEQRLRQGWPAEQERAVALAQLEVYRDCHRQAAPIIAGRLLNRILQLQAPDDGDAPASGRPFADLSERERMHCEREMIRGELGPYRLRAEASSSLPLHRVEEFALELARLGQCAHLWLDPVALEEALEAPPPVFPGATISPSSLRVRAGALHQKYDLYAPELSKQAQAEWLAIRQEWLQWRQQQIVQIPSLARHALSELFKALKTIENQQQG